MRSGHSVVLGTGVLCVAVATTLLSAQRATPGATSASRSAQTATAPQTPATRPAPITSRTAAPVQDHNAVVKQYCVGCHNPRTVKVGINNLVLETFDIAKIADNADV